MRERFHRRELQYECADKHDDWHAFIFSDTDYDKGDNDENNNDDPICVEQQRLDIHNIHNIHSIHIDYFDNKSKFDNVNDWNFDIHEHDDGVCVWIHWFAVQCEDWMSTQSM